MQAFLTCLSYASYLLCIFTISSGFITPRNQFLQFLLCHACVRPFLQEESEILLHVQAMSLFFALISNAKMDAITTLETYRNRDLVEKDFVNLKERLNLR